MKMRLAKKIIKTWCKLTDNRYYDTDHSIKESKAFNRFAYLFKKATIRENKTCFPESNVRIYEVMWKRGKKIERKV